MTARETVHTHGCLNCRPDMVPDFTRDDPRYHDYETCGVTLQATVDGVVPGYHKGVYEGADGWVLLASEGLDTSLIHDCPTCTTRDAEGFIAHHEVCVEPLFGRVEVIHDCPRTHRREARG